MLLMLRKNAEFLSSNELKLFVDEKKMIFFFKN